MKTKKSILMALMLGLIFSCTLKAGESKTSNEAVYELKHQISNLFKALPWEDIIDPSGCCVVTVTFKVNDDSVLEDIKVKGENRDLVNYASVMLNRYTIEADKVLIGRKYQMQIRFENKA
jgi:hypothetical protein